MNASHTPNKRWRNFVVNITLISSSLLLVGVALEISLRIAGYNPFGEFLNNERAIFIRPSNNPQRIYEATPNARGYGWETNISINSYGFRGREYSIAKPADTYRIIVLGDSITFGNRLAPEENFPAVLEKLYESSGKVVEVLNLGLGGYDTLQEVATLADIGLQFQPDLVILGYCINDIGVASGNVNYIQRLQKYGHWIYRSRLAQWIRVHLDRIDLKQSTAADNRSESFASVYQDYLANINNDQALLSLVEALRLQLQSSSEQTPFLRDYTNELRLRRLRFALEQLRNLQQIPTSRFQVLVLSFPFLLQHPEQSTAFQLVQKIITHEVERLDFEMLNLSSPLASIGYEKLTIRPDDGIHPNALGHLITAETLFHHITISQ